MSCAWLIAIALAILSTPAVTFQFPSGYPGSNGLA